MVTIAAAGLVEVLDFALAKITEAGERLQTGLQRPSSSRHALPHPMRIIARDRASVHSQRRPNENFRGGGDEGVRKWWARVESNHRPPACEADALPLSHAPDRTTSVTLSIDD